MSIKSKEIFETADGAQHATMAAAEAHQFALDNAEQIDVVAESFVNQNELSGRTRAFNINVAKQAVAFILSNGGTIGEDFVAILPSAELQEKLDAEAAKVAAKAAEKKTEAGDTKAEADVEAEADGDDLFGEDA